REARQWATPLRRLGRRCNTREDAHKHSCQREAFLSALLLKSVALVGYTLNIRHLPQLGADDFHELLTVAAVAGRQNLFNQLTNRQRLAAVLEDARQHLTQRRLFPATPRWGPPSSPARS